MYDRSKQRSRTGCQTCRSRKVKCDERPGRCLNCARLNLPCSNATTNDQQEGLVEGSAHTLAGFKRLRTYRSCKACRSSKTRCSGDRPACLRCQHRNAQCVYDGKEAPAWVDTVARAGDELRGSLQQTESASHLSRPDIVPADRRSSITYASDSNGHYFGNRINGDETPILCPEELSWLLAVELPDKNKIISLVEEFFVNMHYLRCFGFIHKPSYLQQLENQPCNPQQDDPLLYTVCALGAKFFVLKNSGHFKLPDDIGLRVGNEWASKAKMSLFMNIHRATVPNTMALVLLHEHDIRVGNYASAFMLTGLAVRMSQALQINLEKSNDILSSEQGLQWSFREARRRLMWSIYIMDSWVGSGADEMTLLREGDIKIQLPCDERNFNLEIPCIVETLGNGGHLPFDRNEDCIEGSVDTFDLQAQFVRLVSLRRRVLRYIKNLESALSPWLAESEFAQLESSLFLWYQNLPSSLQFTRTAIYMRKESTQLGGLLMLHWTYHQSLCDLNRIGMPGILEVRKLADFSPEQSDFQKRTQDRCIDNATAIALIFEEALRHGPEVLADTWLPIIAHDSTRVIVHYVTHKLGTSEKKYVMIRPHAVSCIQANILALKRMFPMFQLSKPLYATASNMVRIAGFEVTGLADVQLSSKLFPPEYGMSTALASSVQSTARHVLDPLAIYRMACRDIGDQDNYAPA